jgi:MFS family permease
LYLQYVKGLNPRDAGLILVAQPIVMAIFSPMSGRLSEKIEPRILSSIGMAFSAAGLIILTFFNVNTSHLSIILSLLLLGFGFALFSTPNTNAVMSSVEKRYLGIASATLSTMRLTGQMLSMGVATLTISIFVGNVKISSSNIDGFLHAMQFAFIIFALLCVLGVFASLTRGKHLNRVS